MKIKKIRKHKRCRKTRGSCEQNDPQKKMTRRPSFRFIYFLNFGSSVMSSFPCMVTAS